MNRKKLIITDLLLVIGIILLTYASDGFNKAIMPLMLLIISAFTGCFIRHANYYKLTKKIY
ncbi:hypothetical protein M2273_004525 [Mucilaginibacter lappiensis]|jgi:hypothetical protein